MLESGGKGRVWGTLAFDILQETDMYTFPEKMLNLT
jgi:hypothetical protein